MGALDELTGTEEPKSEESELQNEHPDVALGGARPAGKGSFRSWVIAACVVIVTLAIVLPPLFIWQSENQQKALSLSNMRRVANGCLLYSQDWDERMPPPARQVRDGFISWPRLIRPYVLLDDAFSNPSNPVKPFADRPLLHDAAEERRPVDTSYALNRRFWGEFGPGAFPVGNLEIPEMTALIVEAGRMAADPRHPRLSRAPVSGIAVDTYGDTTDRIQGMSPYPSVHGGQFGIVAVDGHGVMTRVLFYAPKDGPHDAKFGRIGDSIYNWNGGHPNGETDRPAHE